MEVVAGDCVIVNVDGMMASDTIGLIAIKVFREMGGVKLEKPNSTVLILDYATPCPNERTANLHETMRQFAM